MRKLILLKLLKFIKLCLVKQRSSQATLFLLPGFVSMFHIYFIETTQEEKNVPKTMLSIEKKTGNIS